MSDRGPIRVILKKNFDSKLVFLGDGGEIAQTKRIADIELVGVALVVKGIDWHRFICSL